MSTSVEFIPDARTEKVLNTVGDKVAYAVARQTLDYTMEHIPKSIGKSTSGQLRRSTLVYGVRGSSGIYSIGSVTSYAKYVYNMGAGTHWTTPNTFGKWFHRVFEQKHELMLKNAINKYGR